MIRPTAQGRGHLEETPRASHGAEEIQAECKISAVFNLRIMCRHKPTCYIMGVTAPPSVVVVIYAKRNLYIWIVR